MLIDSMEGSHLLQGSRCRLKRVKSMYESSMHIFHLIFQERWSQLKNALVFNLMKSYRS